MANNRMGIRCKNCGDVFLLAKTYLNGYYISNNNSKENLYDNLNIFFDKHKYCNNPVVENDYEPKFKKTNFSEENSFEICYEIYREAENE